MSRLFLYLATLVPATIMAKPASAEHFPRLVRPGPRTRVSRNGNIPERYEPIPRATRFLIFLRCPPARQAFQIVHYKFRSTRDGACALSAVGAGKASTFNSQKVPIHLTRYDTAATQP